MSLGAVWQVIKNLPAIIKFIKEILSQIETLKKEHKEKKNEEVRQDAENAKTPEQKQDAVNKAARRFGGK